ncbi:recombining binding protein suppressor of hairless-like protein [Chiroxiphia lanceolata]|uniref:recombining binding protein suppressor of hairless-like protein n=1 Tax=Chiroxiphia lanceolata TaxID=296741 RepID=UPI0013CEC7CA|nr:recombining binding protein suppressor of hairless-like protein [Chiroxiphia lanceolata]
MEMDPQRQTGAAVPAEPPTHPCRPRSRSPPRCWLRSNPYQANLLRDGVRRYLQLPADQTVLILHAKVAQKSYGNEKRFFCPPPCVYLSGPGWKLKQEQIKARDLGEAGFRVCGYMGLDSMGSSLMETQKLSFEEQPDAKEIGTFHSKLIKVISKPSQKKQSLKNTDLCISSGSKVSLFNRLRSQTVSTRYRLWRGSLHRQRQAPECCPRSEFPLREGYIRYGSVVQLVCTATGVTLPPLVSLHPCGCRAHGPGRSVAPRDGATAGMRRPIIRKVMKQYAMLDVDEPISQLHKCAFQFQGSDRIVFGAVTLRRHLPARRNPTGLLNDGSCWTIISTETVEYTFSESLACVREPVSPVPLIAALQLTAVGTWPCWRCRGSISTHLKVWFGDVEAETMYSDWRWLRYPLTVPLLLIRDDGLIYSSSFTFTYTPEQSCIPGQQVLSDVPQDSDKLLDSIHQEFTRTNFHLFMQS